VVSTRPIQRSLRLLPILREEWPTGSAILLRAGTFFASETTRRARVQRLTDRAGLTDLSQKRI
jgi:hypothetical protein